MQQNNLANDYRQAASVIVKHKWVYLLPLFSVLLGFIPSIMAYVFFKRTQPEMFNYPISLFPNPTLDERLLLIFQHFPISQTLGAVSTFSLVGFGISFIFFLIFIKYLIPTLKKHSVIGKLLLFTLIGAIVGSLVA